MIAKFLLLAGTLLLLGIALEQFRLLDSFTSTENITLTEEQINYMDKIAIPSIISYFSGTILIMIGIFLLFYNLRIQQQDNSQQSYGKIKKYYIILSNNIYYVINYSASKKIFKFFFVFYFIVLLYLNNTIIFNPIAIKFIEPPISNLGIYIIGCCGHPGAFPVISIHLTEFFGFIIFPINLILPLFYSLLISISIGTITISLLNKRKQNKKNSNKSSCSITTIGLIGGFLISCPTCAINILFSSVLGGSIITSSSIILSYYQPIIALVNFVFIFGVLILLSERNLKLIESYNMNP